MKQNLLKIFSFAIIGFALASCSNPTKMVKNGELVTGSANPSVMEVVANKINATVTMNFPEGYFHPNAVVELVPMIAYNNTLEAHAPVMLQGEKVTNNYRVVPNAGGSVSFPVSFDYKKGMERSQLQVQASLIYKDKVITFACPYMVADGVNTTSMFVAKGGTVALAPDNYKDVIPGQEKAQIFYLLDSYIVRSAQLKTDEIKMFEQFLADSKANERVTIVNTQFHGYASPDGKYLHNEKLAENRAKSAHKAFEADIKKNHKIDLNIDAPAELLSTAENWEGFHELVTASNIPEKDLILRVLQMYSDPEVREREIKNMSKVYLVLAKDILPKLRLTKLIANTEFKNYTAQELTALAMENIEILDEEGLLRAATLFDNNDTKITLYKKAAEKYNSSRGYNNLAVAYMNANKLNDAKSALSKVSNKDTYYYNALGVLALREGNHAEALQHFAKSNLPEAKYNAGTIDILNGKYADAANKLAGAGQCNEHLAFILTKQYDKALKSLEGDTCPKSNYFRAIIAARQGKSQAEVRKYLDEAAKMPALKERMANDIEFAKYLK